MTDTPEEVQPDPDTWKWLVTRAAEAHHGSISAAAAAVLRAARLAEQAPTDPWARLQAIARARSFPPYRVPVALIIEFIDGYDPARDGASAADVLDKLRRALAR